MKKSNVIYATPGSVIFGVKVFHDTLTDIIKKRNIVFKPFYAPVMIDSKKKRYIPLCKTQIPVHSAHHEFRDQ
ncbi:MAG: hypothetical protein IPQ03_12495 [Bacteroidetes bacterium]|nr:hypothetical protein [Bacteroidota bacterium]